MLKDSGTGAAPASLTGYLVEFLAFGRGRRLTGKLLSARYDRFRNWSDDDIELVARTEIFSRRRLDPFTPRPLLSDPRLLDL